MNLGIMFGTSNKILTSDELRSLFLAQISSTLDNAALNSFVTAFSAKYAIVPGKVDVNSASKAGFMLDIANIFRQNFGFLSSIMYAENLGNLNKNYTVIPISMVGKDGTVTVLGPKTPKEKAAEEKTERASGSSSNLWIYGAGALLLAGGVIWFIKRKK